MRFLKIFDVVLGWHLDMVKIQNPAFFMVYSLILSVAFIWLLLHHGNKDFLPFFVGVLLLWDNFVVLRLCQERKRNGSL